MRTQATQDEETTTHKSLEMQQEGNIQIVPFALLPFDQNNDTFALFENNTRRGIVGNVIFFGTSAYVWANWGAVNTIVNTAESQISQESTPVIGQGSPIMGSLGLAMPRKRYAGMQSDIPSYTQLIGGSSDEDMILGSGMACRLSDKLGFPVFVSLSIAGENTHLFNESTPLNTSSDPMMDENVRLTVARIEREVIHILLNKKAS